MNFINAVSLLASQDGVFASPVSHPDEVKSAGMRHIPKFLNKAMRCRKLFG
jgi:hypothetical protein